MRSRTCSTPTIRFVKPPSSACRTSTEGETVHAFVALRAGASVTEAELIDFCKARMAAYKYPRAVFFVDELPKTASGKILRRELRRS
ncbi:hypothetical protein AB0B25_21995 [Nocardia sp. NPDC049190]|uniref:AMP-binding enzyme n=1 Tax=Nocardia sp. NPDC049190 TaxID=3155650 RepID=UPI00340C3D79